MGPLSFLSTIFKPATDLIDSLHTSEKERLDAKAVLLELQTQVVTQTIEYEKQLLSSQTAIITAEATSDSWLTRSWRPMTMMVLLGILIWTWVIGPPENLSPEIIDDVFALIKIGIGGYIGSRGIEKTVPGIVRALKKAEET